MAACRMNNQLTHTPVLLSETLEYLSLCSEGIYVDCTFGRGGHARAILNQIGSQGRLYALDRDPEAVAYARQFYSKDERFRIFHSSFSRLVTILKSEEVYGKVNGILFDLGVSSPQLDNPERGFSFSEDGNLDMRMDSTTGLDAASWLAKVDEKELARVLWEYGDERYSRRIARSIVRVRTESPIRTTKQLASIITRAMPRLAPGKHAATRSFLAIRIAINQELRELEHGLKHALESLAPGGRLVVISFHSLEDRIVKQFIQKHVRGAPEHQIPLDLPIKECIFSPRLKRIGSSVKASTQEVMKNVRSRSAILRIAEKIS